MLAKKFFMIVAICSLVFPVSVTCEIKGEVDYLTYNKEYEVTEYSSETTGVYDAHGIHFFNNQLLVSDWKKNSICILDLDCNIVDRIGSLGSGELEFINPTGITSDNKKIYIIDSGNNRIQVLNDNFTYDRSIRIPEIPGAYFFGIAVNNGQIYINSNSLMPLYGGVYSGTIEGNFKQITNVLFGPIVANGTDVYAMNSLYVYEEGDDIIAESGQNMMFRLLSDGTSELFSLPEQYVPIGFVIHDENLVCLSASSHKLDTYTKDGKYVDTIADFVPNVISSRNDLNIEAAITGIGMDTYYIAGYISSKIIKVALRN